MGVGRDSGQVAWLQLASGARLRRASKEWTAETEKCWTTGCMFEKIEFRSPRLINGRSRREKDQSYRNGIGRGAVVFLDDGKATEAREPLSPSTSGTFRKVPYGNLAVPLAWVVVLISTSITRSAKTSCWPAARGCRCGWGTSHFLTLEPVLLRPPRPRWRWFGDHSAVDEQKSLVLRQSTPAAAAPLQ